MSVEARTAQPSPEAWTVQRILDWTTQHLRTHGSETPRLDSEILLAHARHCQRIELYTHYNDVLSDDERALMRELVKRRAQAEPVAYLVGFREFFGLDFAVTPDVLIPRPDTETLVMECLDLIKSLPAPRVLDVGTGTGCIAVAVAVNHSAAQVLALDVSPAALAIAERNAQAHAVQTQVTFRESNVLSGLGADERFHVIASNPPYIALSEMDGLQAEIRDHEPHLALAGGPDGLDMIRELITMAPQHLHQDGHLMLELSPEQSERVVELVRCADLGDVRVINDLSGLPRVVRARRGP